ncbi:hypothetical protein Patl1_15107 [Pistacia atlantica]|uniref:Uncharacterized protein n=1 Tax=Pistacia atlantica TaxID=434234 RepID=A0ACC1B5P3_9ROSI|nr:hypothetical protein Patl1_15107 [Pistacia atlantica]
MCSHMGMRILFNFRLICNGGIILFTAAMLIELVLSEDQSKYEACAPINCGLGPNISYPFYVKDAGEEFCGHPGFRIACENDEPIYKTSSGLFIIKDISYENQWFRLVDKEVLSNDSCITPVHNFSFDRASLIFRPYHAELFFFRNCNVSFEVNYTKTEVPCASNATYNSSIALVPRDEEANWSRIACEYLVTAPVQLEESKVNRTIYSFDYVKLLKDGFTLKWTGQSCAGCRNSGGRCGFEEDKNVCFCPDGSHAQNCKDGRLNLHSFFI